MDGEEGGEEYCSDSFESIDSLRRAQHREQQQGESSLPQLRTLSGESADDRRKGKFTPKELGSAGRQRRLVKGRKAVGVMGNAQVASKTRQSSLEEDGLVSKMTKL